MKRILLGLTTLILLPLLAVLFVNPQSDSKVISPVTENIPFTDTEVTTTKSSRNLSDLQEIVIGLVTENRDSFAVAVIDLTDGSEYYMNENRRFEAASLYKLWIMAAAFDQIGKKRLDEKQTLSQTIETLNRKFDIASDEAELTEGSVTMTVSEAIKQMISVSHNYAALLLSEKIGLSRVSEYMKALGLNGSTLGNPPETTAKSIADFFRKLYEGKVGNSEQSEKMIGILKNQQIRRKLPKYLPEGTVIAHKTGELGPYTHDAGIVYTPKGDYVIVILTESPDPAKTEDIMARLSKRIFEYMQKI